MVIKPPYAKNIVADIRARIASGELQPGDKLDSVPKMAVHYGCSPESVRSAMTILKATGEIISYHGIGHFVPED